MATAPADSKIVTPDGRLTPPWQAYFGQGNTRTAAEIAAGVTPVNYAYAPGIVDRYGNNTTPGTTDMTSAFTAAAAQNAQGGAPIQMLASTYLITGVSLRYNNAAIIGPGSSVCTLKQNPSGFGTGGLIEFGNTAGGNGATAYDKFIARGFTIDGNRANIASPTDDLHGHGLILTKITHFHISDVRAVNCWNAGIIPVINSNFGYIDGYVENCGNATYTGPGFDTNSSTDIIANVVSNGCYQGARILDNCYRCNYHLTINNATSIGFIANNQSVNFSYGNKVTAVIGHGCSTAGVQIGNNVLACEFDLTVNQTTGALAVQEVYYAGGNRPIGNTYKVATSKNTQAAVEIGGDNGTWTIESYLDAVGSTSGTYTAVTVDGQNNIFSVNVTDAASPLIRGISMTANSVNNELVAFNRNTLVSYYSDSGSKNRFTPEQYRGNATFNLSSVATGVTNIGTITVTGALTGSGWNTQISLGVTSAGVVFYGEVTANNTVTVWTVNETGAAVNLGTSVVVYALVTSSQP